MQKKGSPEAGLFSLVGDFASSSSLRQITKTQYFGRLENQGLDPEGEKPLENPPENSPENQLELLEKVQK